MIFIRRTGDFNMTQMPKIMYIRVSENCNSHCFMCHYAGTNDAYNITIQEYKDIIELMDRIGSYELIRFTGGETLLHPELCEMIKMASQHDYKTSIITNGYLLPFYADKLIESNLTQCIVSLDGANSAMQDKLRGFKGCFDNIILGLRKLRQTAPNMILRINTVVSPFNIDQLVDMLTLLEQCGVNQWSIIPLKYKQNLWKSSHIETYYNFLEKNNHTSIKMLGYSSHWAGRNEKEIKQTFCDNMHFRPAEICHNVDFIRFFIPNKKLLLPCNCVPHRLSEIAELEDVISCQDLEDQASRFRKWLSSNSKDVCTGCEPLNVYLSDHPDEIAENVMIF